MSSQNSSSNQSSNWRNPSASHCAKYNLRPPAAAALHDAEFTPTPEEDLLLDLYERVRQLERLAARSKEEAARAKLAAREAEFHKTTASPKNKRRKRREKILDEADLSDNEDEDDDVLEDDDDDSEDMEEDAEELRARRQAKLEALREEVQQAKQQENPDDALRAEHLVEDSLDTGIGIRKKQRTEQAEPSSLIANLQAAQTPPHDFSKSLELNNGTTLFPQTTQDGQWTPPEGASHPNDNAFSVDLLDFDMQQAQNGVGNNTLAIKFQAPSDSKRFSLNLAAPDHNDFDSILFHFNPRQHERGGQLVINDKQDGIWGQSIAVPLSQVPLMFGQTSCTLIIQVNGEGFDIFLEGQHCARLEHRREIENDVGKLILQFPSTDDYSSPENWIVYRVWWGSRPLLAQTDVSGVAGVNLYSSLHPRKLFVSGLSRIFSEADVDLRRAELERAFHKYGGAHGVTVIAPTNVTYAFVETESEKQADLALTELAGTYRLNRARRTKHEALQDERAAKEASGGAKEVSTWD